ncbi:glycosyltransferase family 2 protein [soil metagenome]
MIVLSALAPSAAHLIALARATAISVVLPVRNECGNLPILLSEIESAIVSMNRSFEVIAVDDGSTDGSRELLLKLADTCPHLRVICLRRNYGQAAALDAGFRVAAGELVVTLDADGQNDPADIPKLVRVMEEQKLDCVSGRRAGRKDSFLPRVVPSTIANFLIRCVTHTRNRDLGCALKVYRRAIIEELHLYGEMHRFISVLIEGMGATTTQVDVNHRPRLHGTSKYGLARTFKVMLDLVTVWFMRGFQTKPIYVFGGMGMLLMTIAVSLSGFVLYQKWFEGIWVHRNPIFILSMVTSIMAVQFLGMGLIAEMMVRTYFESQGKSPYLISLTKGFRQEEPVPQAFIARGALNEFARDRRDLEKRPAPRVS